MKLMAFGEHSLSAWMRQSVARPQTPPREFCRWIQFVAMTPLRPDRQRKGGWHSPTPLSRRPLAFRQIEIPRAPIQWKIRPVSVALRPMNVRFWILGATNAQMRRGQFDPAQRLEWRRRVER